LSDEANRPKNEVAPAAEKFFVPSFLNQASEETIEAIKELGLDSEITDNLIPKPSAIDVPPDMCFCNLCHKQVSQPEIDAFVQKIGGLRQTCSENPQSSLRREFEAFLEAYDSGTPVSLSKSGNKAAHASTADEGKSVPSNKCRLKLHPTHTLILSALPYLANACNFEQDYLSAAKYFRRLVKTMLDVQPENFPETADFLYALGDALKNYLDKAQRTSKTLPKKTAEQYRTEARNALIKCHRMRVVCMGESHKSTQDVLDVLSEIGGQQVQTYFNEIQSMKTSV